MALYKSIFQRFRKEIKRTVRIGILVFRQTISSVIPTWKCFQTLHFAFRHRESSYILILLVHRRGNRFVYPTNEQLRQPRISLTTEWTLAGPWVNCTSYLLPPKICLRLAQANSTLAPDLHYTFHPFYCDLSKRSRALICNRSSSIAVKLHQKLPSMKISRIKSWIKKSIDVKGGTIKLEQSIDVIVARRYFRSYRSNEATQNSEGNRQQ